MCPDCGSSQVKQIDMAVARKQMVHNTCSDCHLRWWEAARQPVSDSASS
jgi:hypothetical protein